MRLPPAPSSWCSSWARAGAAGLRRRLRLPNRTVILTGDTCHFRVELAHGVPLRGVCTDEQQGVQSIRLLRLLRDAHDAQVWINHDCEDWAMMPHAPEYIE